MEVFRICSTKWADKLTGSGLASRWNSSGFFVIYAAQNCSLACLENLVHRNGYGFDADFSLVTIYIDDRIKKSEILQENLPLKWNKNDEKSHLLCRPIGDDWVKSQNSCVFIVPSAIIPNEKNVLINPNHFDFKSIKIKSIDSFSFDKRLIQ